MVLLEVIAHRLHYAVYNNPPPVVASVADHRRKLQLHYDGCFSSLYTTDQFLYYAHFSPSNYYRSAYCAVDGEKRKWMGNYELFFYCQSDQLAASLMFSYDGLHIVY